jgi:hypothetical protein
MTARALALLLVAAAVGGLATSDAGSAPAADVTLSVQRVSVSPGIHRYRFSGQIAGSAAGEYVAVMQQRCGYSFSTAVAGAETQSGGFWEAEIKPENSAVIAASATFRARWRESLSEPVTILQPIHVDHRRLRPGLFVVYVSGSKEDLTRRSVILQRFTGGKWTGIERGRLTRVFRSTLFQARFTVKARGWKLRARVPKATAGKCLAPAVSETWTS